VSPVKYELGFYIPENDILHSHRRENLKFYIGFYIPEDDILHIHRRENLKSNIVLPRLTDLTVSVLLTLAPSHVHRTFRVVTSITDIFSAYSTSGVNVQLLTPN
jgi:hypothetical protein